MIAKNGEYCGERFDTIKALRCHQRHAEKHDDCLSFLSLVTEPVCPWCSSCFSSLQAARNHVDHSMRFGTCHTDAAVHIVKHFQTKKEMICKMCGEEFDDILVYNRHIRQYARSPEFIELSFPNRCSSSSSGCHLHIAHHSNQTTGHRSPKHSGIRRAIQKEEDRCGLCESGPQANRWGSCTDDHNSCEIGIEECTAESHPRGSNRRQNRDGCDRISVKGYASSCRSLDIRNQGNGTTGNRVDMGDSRIAGVPENGASSSRSSQIGQC